MGWVKEGVSLTSALVSTAETVWEGTLATVLTSVPGTGAQTFSILLTGFWVLVSTGVSSMVSLVTETVFCFSTWS